MRKVCFVLLLIVVACRKSEQVADNAGGKSEPSVTQAAAPPSNNNPNIAPESTNNPNRPSASNNDPNNPPPSNNDPNRIVAPIPMEEQPVRYRSGGKTWLRGGGNVDPLPAAMELKLGADGYYRDAQGRKVLLTIVEDEGKPVPR